MQTLNLRLRFTVNHYRYGHPKAETSKMDRNPPITNQERHLLTSLKYCTFFPGGPRHDWRQRNKQGAADDSCSNCIRRSFFPLFQTRRLSRYYTFAFLQKKNAWSQVSSREAAHSIFNFHCTVCWVTFHSAYILETYHCNTLLRKRNWTTTKPYVSKLGLLFSMENHVNVLV